MPRNIRDLEDSLAFVVGHVQTAQLDIMDGKFVRGRTWPYFSRDESFEKLLSEEIGMPFWEKLNYEIDLMVREPETVMGDWIAAGATRIVVHIESTAKLEEIIKNKSGIELGFALNIDTSTDDILPYLEDIDFVQFMGINKIGFQGEPFDERVIDKIHDFHNAHPEVMISVDGGVTLDNAHELVDVGARRLISGSAIFESGNIAGMIARFKGIM